MIRGIKQFGKGVATVGLVGCFVMLVVGTIAIDIVIIASLFKQTENNRGRRNEGNAFLTGMLWGMMFSNNNNRNFYGDVGLSLLLSPITTGIAIGLSFYLGVPAVGIGLLIGWLGVAAISGIGLAIYGIADYFDRPAQVYPSRGLPKIQHHHRNEYQPVVTNPVFPAAVVVNQRTNVQVQVNVEPTAPSAPPPYSAQGFFPAGNQAGYDVPPPPYNPDYQFSK